MNVAIEFNDLANGTVRCKLRDSSEELQGSKGQIET
jgi:hypothetical protein